MSWLDDKPLHCSELDPGSGVCLSCPIDPMKAKDITVCTCIALRRSRMCPKNVSADKQVI